jgi:hypothetical protein
MSDRVTDKLGEKFDALGGKRGCRGIDALVYINLMRRYIWPNEFDPNCPVVSRLRPQAWRTVPVLMPPYGIMFYATDDARSFSRTPNTEYILTKIGPQVGLTPSPACSRLLL